MKIFILGCGFLGSKLAAHFEEQGHLVTASTTSESKLTTLSEIASEAVLLNEETDYEALLAHQDLLIICAAPKNADEYYAAFYQTAQKVKSALLNNTHVKSVYYTSSCSVYGDKKGEWVDETHPPEPANVQQEILAQTEKVYLNQLPRHIKVCLFRLGEIYGLEKSIEQKMTRLSGSSLPSTGENYTNLIHVSDIVRAVDWAIQKKLTGIFNLCNDSHEKRRDFYHKWCQSLNLQAIQFSAQPTGLHRGNKRVSNHKIKLMGFEFKYPLAEPV